MSRNPTTVLVLAGGDSAERDVSLSSARGIVGALRESQYRVLVSDPSRPDIAPTEDDAEIFAHATIKDVPPDMEDNHMARAEFVRVLSGYQAWGIDIVFSGLHGGRGEDGTIQAILEYLGIPFTGSGAAASALAMDKQRTKHIAGAAGVPVPPGILLQRSALAAGTLEQTARETVGLPLIVKPNAQGSSVGLSLVDDFSQLDAAAQKAFAVDDAVLIEKYIAGRELTQAVVEGIAEIPALEVRPRSGLYDYVHKYQSGNSDYIVPAPIAPDVAAAVARDARRTFHALGLAVYARIDFRLDDEGQHYLLEANTLPGFTATSLVPKSCAAVGVSYAELCDRIVRASLKRWSQ